MDCLSECQNVCQNAYPLVRTKYEMECSKIACWYGMHRCIERVSSGSASQPESLIVKQEGESSISFLKQLESLLVSVLKAWLVET